MIPHRLSKGCDSKLHVGSRVWQTPELGQKTYRHKYCEYNNKDEDNSPKTLNDKNHANFATLQMLVAYMSTDFQVYLISSSIPCATNTPNKNVFFTAYSIISVSFWFLSLNWRKRAKMLSSNDKGIKCTMSRIFCSFTINFIFVNQAINSPSSLKGFTMSMFNSNFSSMFAKIAF